MSRRKAAVRWSIEAFVSESESHVQPALSDAQLAQINQLTTVARFVSGLAHELNNSLQVIGGLVELLAERTDLPGDVAVRIQKIGGQSDKAGAVIRQVLDYVRDPGGQGGASLDLGAVADRALALRRYQLARAGVHVTWERPRGDAVRTWGNERQIQQVILNLLINAEEALAGHPERRLRMDVARAADRVQLAVADSGPGVPIALRTRIFEPFFTTRTSERAVGLGLTAGAAIAAAHGARLVLADTGPGATFILDLPAR